jgi:predicted RNA binding protein YcfA (HicA-like mRNA interferase family)
VRPVSSKELEKVCLLLGCIAHRQKGSHLAMTRPGLARPVIFPANKKELRPDVLRGCMRTLGIDRRELEDLLDRI